MMVEIGWFSIAMLGWRMNLPIHIVRSTENHASLRGVVYCMCMLWRHCPLLERFSRRNTHKENHGSMFSIFSCPTASFFFSRCYIEESSLRFPGRPPHAHCTAKKQNPGLAFGTPTTTALRVPLMCLMNPNYWLWREGAVTKFPWPVLFKGLFSYDQRDFHFRMM